MKIAGSVAIVTGGARGFGKAFTEELLKRGGKVCMADINVSEGLKTEQLFKQKYGEQSLMFMKCDITNEADFKGLWKAAIDRFKYIDIMVNNAGICNEDTPEKMVEINLIGTIRGTSLAAEHMRKDLGGKGGLIVNVASTAGLFPVFFMPSYAASKYGVVGYTRSWASNPLIDKFGVSFACLCPAFSETNMLKDILYGDDPPIITYNENKETMKQMVKSFGINKVEEVASVFIELVETPDNNGTVVSINKEKGARYHFSQHPHRL